MKESVQTLSVRRECWLHAFKKSLHMKKLHNPNAETKTRVLQKKMLELSNLKVEKRKDSKKSRKEKGELLSVGVLVWCRLRTGTAPGVIVHRLQRLLLLRPIPQ